MAIKRKMLKSTCAVVVVSFIILLSFAIPALATDELLIVEAENIADYDTQREEATLFEETYDEYLYRAEEEIVYVDVAPLNALIMPTVQAPFGMNRATGWDHVPGAASYTLYVFDNRDAANVATALTAESLAVASANFPATGDRIVTDMRMITFTELNASGAVRVLPQGFTPAGLGASAPPIGSDQGRNTTNLRPGQYLIRVVANPADAAAGEPGISAPPSTVATQSWFNIAMGPDELRVYLESRLPDIGTILRIADVRGRNSREASQEGWLRYTDISFAGGTGAGVANAVPRFLTGSDGITRTPSEITIVLYCRGGGRSTVAAQRLRESGFRVIDAQGINQIDFGLVYGNPIHVAPGHESANFQVRNLTFHANETTWNSGSRAAPTGRMTGYGFVTAPENSLSWRNIPHASFRVFAFGSATETNPASAIASSALIPPLSIDTWSAGSTTHNARVVFDVGLFDLPDEGPIWFRVQAVAGQGTTWGGDSPISAQVAIRAETLAAPSVSAPGLTGNLELSAIADGASRVEVYLFSTREAATVATAATAADTAVAMVTLPITGSTLTQDLRELTTFVELGGSGAVRNLPAGFTPANDTPLEHNLRPGQYLVRVRAISADPAVVANSELSAVPPVGYTQWFNFAMGPDEVRLAMEANLNNLGTTFRVADVRMNTPAEVRYRGWLRFTDIALRNDEAGIAAATAQILADAGLLTDQAGLVTVLVYCQSGGRTPSVAQRLAELGFNVINAQGISQLNFGLMYGNPPVPPYGTLPEALLQFAVRDLSFDLQTNTIRWRNLPWAGYILHIFEDSDETDPANAIVSFNTNSVDENGVRFHNPTPDFDAFVELSIYNLKSYLPAGTHTVRIQAVDGQNNPIIGYIPATNWGGESRVSTEFVTLPTLFSITIDPDVTGGTIDASPTVALRGTTIYVVTSPDAGFRKVDGTLAIISPAGLTISEENSFVMPAADVVLTADFVAIRTPGGGSSAPSVPRPSLPTNEVTPAEVSEEDAQRANNAVEALAQDAANRWGATISSEGSAIRVVLDADVPTVETLVDLPYAIDTSRVTTMARLNEDGTLTPVPTRVDADGNIVVLLTETSILVPLNVRATFNDLDRVYTSVRLEIERAASLLIVEGFGDGSFRPSEDVTVRQAVTMFLRATGIPVSWANAMATGVENGFIPEGLNPNAAKTRIETAHLIVNALARFDLRFELTDSETDNLLAPFGDLDNLTSYDRSVLAITVHLGIFRGFSDGTMRPDGVLNRSQMASLSVRLQDVLLGM